MEQPSTETIVKTLSLLNHLHKNKIIDDNMYEDTLPYISKYHYNFNVLSTYKKLLLYLEDKPENLHFIEFFNIEKEKHLAQYEKLFSKYL